MIQILNTVFKLITFATISNQTFRFIGAVEMLFQLGTKLIVTFLNQEGRPEVNVTKTTISGEASTASETTAAVGGGGRSRKNRKGQGKRKRKPDSKTGSSGGTTAATSGPAASEASSKGASAGTRTSGPPQRNSESVSVPQNISYFVSFDKSAMYRCNHDDLAYNR